MATFKALVGTAKKDGTHPIMIQIYHRGLKRYIPTSHYADKKDLNRRGELRESSLIALSNRIIDDYRNKIKKLYDINNLDSQQIKDFLMKPEEQKEIDFIGFSRKFIERQTPATGKNTTIALNAMIAYLGLDKVPVTSINLKFLQGFESYLRNVRKISNTGIKDYIGKLRQLFLAARNEYNDEDKGKMPIPHYPFSKFKMPKAVQPAKRNIKPSLIKKIKGAPNFSRRADLGRDVFMLSFYLVGINTVDLFTATDYKNGRLSYNRAKTKGRKADKAFISIKVEPEAIPLFEKHKDFTGKRVFNFYHQYENADGFNTAVNLGLKTVVAKNAISENVTSYYARHSWATIARNICKVSKDDVHFALNHSDPDMKITDLYIQEDFSIIDKANRKVLDTLK